MEVGQTSRGGDNISPEEGYFDVQRENTDCWPVILISSNSTDYRPHLNYLPYRVDIYSLHGQPTLPIPTPHHTTPYRLYSRAQQTGLNINWQAETESLFRPADV